MNGTGNVDGLLLRALRVERDGRTLLDIPELLVPPAACTVVSGAGDAGKTLLAATLAGTTGGSRGEVRLDGRTLAGSPSSRRRAGLVAVPNLPLRVRGITVSEALALAAPRRRDRDVSAALDRFSLLARRRTTRCERLSGGEHQLLRIACAWVAEPRALVLDSPTTGLAADLVTAVVAMAGEEADRGVAVLWLDQPGAPAPEPPRLRLDAGRLSATLG